MANMLPDSNSYSSTNPISISADTIFNRQAPLEMLASSLGGPGLLTLDTSFLECDDVSSGVLQVVEASLNGIGVG